MKTKVFARIKPSESPILYSTPFTVTAYDQTFTFDTVFHHQARQTQIYQQVASEATSNLSLGQSSILAFFGVSSQFPSRSGKSYSIRGGQGRNKGLSARSVEQILSWITRDQRRLQLRMSIVQVFYQNATDLMVFSNRALALNDSRTPVQGLTEYPVKTLAQFYTNLCHSLQVRKTLQKADPKLSLKSHTILYLKVYEMNLLMSQIVYVQLAGSQNASNDIQVARSNNLSAEERKSIAKGFNAFSAVFSGKNAWNESVLTKCLRGHSDYLALVLTIEGRPFSKKHCLAALRYSQRLVKSSVVDQENILKEISELRAQLSTASEPVSSTQAFEFFAEKDTLLKKIEHQVAQIRVSGPALVCPSQLQLDCDFIRNLLQQYRNRYLGRSRTPNRTPLRQKQPSPQRFELIQQQAQFQETRKTLEFYMRQASDYKKDFERVSQELFQKKAELENSKTTIENMKSKMQEYTRILQGLQSSNKFIQESLSNEEHYQEQIKGLQSLLDKQREINRMNQKKIESKEKTIIEKHSSNQTQFSQTLQLKSKIRSHKSRVSELQKTNSAQSHSLNQLKYKLDLQLQQKSKIQDQFNSYKKQAEQAVVKLQQAENKIFLLQQKSSEIELSLNSARQEADNRKKKNSRLSVNLQELQTAYQGCSVQTTRISQVCQELKQTNESLVHQNSALKQKEQQIQSQNAILQQEIEELSRQLQETSQLLHQQQTTLFQMQSSTSEISTLKLELKHKKKKHRVLKENNQKLIEDLKEFSQRYEQDLKQCCEQRDSIFSELEFLKHTQNEELSIVESQVVEIQSQMEKLRCQNRQFANREQELLKQVRNLESARNKYRQKSVDLKLVVKDMESQISETDEYLKQLIQQQRESRETNPNEQRDAVLRNRLKALNDIQTMIKSHKYS